MRKFKILSILLMLIVCCGTAFAQTITISGTITDSRTSEELLGASVMIKGTTSGTITDFDGRYTLSAPSDAVLVISYVGYISQEVRVGNRTNINVQLSEDTQALDEVVIVGAVFKKSDLTGAVGNVSQAVLQERPVTTVNEAIQGRVAGVFFGNSPKPGDPNDDAKIRIRGTNTLNASGDPIYVVDGLIMDKSYSGFNSINVNDVASVEVLKDASATALYGSRGANGVIVITTKKGKSGEGKVSYDGWIGINSYANKPKTMNGRQLFDLRKQAYVNGHVIENGSAGVQDYINNVVMGSNDVFADYEFDAYQSGIDHDWLKEVTRTGFQQNHAVNFSGGTDKGTYYLSFGYSDVKGLVQNTSEQKYTGRVNIEQNVKPWLKVGTNTSFTRTEHDIVEDYVYEKARNANPMLAIDYDIMTLNYAGRYDENNFNPLRSLEIDYEQKRNRVLSSNFININPMSGLNLRTTFSIDFLDQQKYRYTPRSIQESLRYTYYGQTKDDRDNRINWQWDTSLTYDKSFGKHRINGLFGTSMSRIDRNYLNIDARGFITDLLSYHNVQGAGNKIESTMKSEFKTETLASYIFRANYIYANKYYLTGTARYDGSSKFGSGHRWGIFPSFSGAWNVAGEDFMQDQDIFDSLKLRVGYGVVGNQSIDDYAYQTLYEPKPTDGTGGVVFDSDKKRGTKDITWEKQKQTNIGIDMSFLNNRITFSADAFWINNSNLLMKRNLFSTSGYDTAFENVGTIQNRGVEFSVNAGIIETKDFQWNLSANISHDKNKVTKLYGDTDVIYKVDGDNNIQKEENLFIGQSKNTIFIMKYGGIAQESDMDRLNKINFDRNVNPGDYYPVDVDNNGYIDANDRVVVGSTDPKFYGGFASDFTYKNITLNAVFTYSYGAKKLSSYYETLASSSGLGPATVDLTDYWSPENTNAQFHRPIAGISYSRYGYSDLDVSVQNASYLRLSTLSLAYTFPSQVAQSMKLGSLRVYTTAQNVFCVTNYKGYDPETGDWYPPTRMFVFGVNVSF